MADGSVRTLSTVATSLERGFVDPVTLVMPKGVMPIGAEVVSGGVHFRVWAPDARRVAVVLEQAGEPAPIVPLMAEENGYHSGLVEQATAGSRYRFQLDDGKDLFPDPASRFQPEGPLGPSQVVDASKFRWTDGQWSGVGAKDQVIYEMHVGAFTQAGTWSAAMHELPALAELGITIVEVMPVADFAGTFGWGYDGVNLFAPTRLYGSADSFRSFVDLAHSLNLAVILDVVYNHFGPIGNFITSFSEHYCSDRHKTDWGKAINFDGSEAEPVREFFISNAAYWIREFHLDGLRIDATQNIYDFDTNHTHVLTEVAAAARAAAERRSIFIVAENEPQNVRLLLDPADGGHGMDAIWNDDLHHSAMVALTGRNEAYYTDYRGSAQEFVSAAKYGFLYQGQRYRWQKQPRGTQALRLPPERFVAFLQNHDQVANTGTGLRVNELAGPGRCRAMTAYVLLGPATPMLFMGQEFAASAPFFYFANHDPGLAEAVDTGRKEFLAQFPSLATPEIQAVVPAPHDPETFKRCKLDFSERESHAGVLAMHRELLRLRREDPVLRVRTRGCVDGAVFGNGAFVLRFFGEDEDRLLLVNLETELRFDPAPEPLLAPPPGQTWSVLWSSEDPRWGGSGTPPIYSEENWRIPGHCAVLLAPADGPEEMRAPTLIEREAGEAAGSVENSGDVDVDPAANGAERGEA